MGSVFDFEAVYAGHSTYVRRRLQWRVVRPRERAICWRAAAGRVLGPKIRQFDREAGAVDGRSKFTRKAQHRHLRGSGDFEVA